jgi:hypothetical protein
MFIDDIDNRLASNEDVDCDDMFQQSCAEPEYREALQKGQLLGKVQSFFFRWWST